MLVAFLCFLVVLFAGLFFHSRRSLLKLAASKRKYSMIQKFFSTAVTDIEDDLEQERRNTARFVKILETIHDGVAIMDRDSNIKYANPALWKLYDIPADRMKQYMNKSWVDLHSPRGQDQIRSEVLPALAAKGMWRGESDVRTAGGAVIRAELYISAIQDGYIGFIRDVTDRHRAESDREKLLAQLHQLQKSEAVERVLKALIREFSNGLCSVYGYSCMMMNDLPEQSETYDSARKIFEAGRKMQSVLEQARLLTGTQVPALAQVMNMQDVIHGVEGELRSRIALPFRIDIGIESPFLNLCCDKNHVSQLLFHVLANAIENGAPRDPVELKIAEYEDEDGVIQDTQGQTVYRVDERDGDGSVTLRYGRYDAQLRYARIAARNRGAGICRDIMDHVLDPFFSAGAAMHRKGLGLSIVKSILRQSRGYLLIDSRMDSGTEVTILLPLHGGVRAEGGSLPAIKAAPPEGRAPA